MKDSWFDRTCSSSFNTSIDCIYIGRTGNCRFLYGDCEVAHHNLSHTRYYFVFLWAYLTVDPRIRDEIIQNCNPKVHPKTELLFFSGFTNLNWKIGSLKLQIAQTIISDLYSFFIFYRPGISENKWPVSWFQEILRSVQSV